MSVIHIDIETKSGADLRKTGVYRYADDPDFKILLFAYSIDGAPVECIDLTREELPAEIIEMLTDPGVTKWAHNAQFERVALSKHLGEKLDPAQWRCTMIHAAQLGLPLSLDKLAAFLEIDQQKDQAGKRLINKFSTPTKDGGWNSPADHPADWKAFINYCIRDVEAEMGIADVLDQEPVPEHEWELYALDQRINDAGIGVDVGLANGAVTMSSTNEADTMAKLDLLTGLDNPKSAAQLKNWLGDQGVLTDSIDKASVEEMLGRDDLPDNARQVLKLRKLLSSTSVKKYEAILNMVAADSRVHGLLQFYGASRTGRWSGRGVQIQNLPRNKLEGEELDQAREQVKAGERVPDSTLKQLIRTALVPADGHEFLVSDFSAIEARVLAWVAGERWALEAFATHGKIYEATAAAMYKVSIDEVDGDLRQKGKVAVLACGYGGGVNALMAMGALKSGLTERELQPIIDQWRGANRNIVKLWYDTERAAKGALAGAKTRVAGGKIRFEKRGSTLFMRLPSGRELAYQKVRLVNDRIEYKGQGTAAAFTTQHTWGGKLVENLTQAIARDLLAEAMVNIDLMGYRIVGHVHDEIIVEHPKNASDISEIEGIMALPPAWAEGLPLDAEGFKTDYYKK